MLGPVGNSSRCDHWGPPEVVGVEVEHGRRLPIKVGWLPAMNSIRGTPTVRIQGRTIDRQTSEVVLLLSGGA